MVTKKKNWVWHSGAEQTIAMNVATLTHVFEGGKYALDTKKVNAAITALNRIVFGIPEGKSSNTTNCQTEIAALLFPKKHPRSKHSRR